jgi:hypothetical protein
MRKNLGCLLLLACCLTACGTNHKTAKAAPPAAATATPDDPLKIRPITDAQLAELKARLGKLYKGMARETVLQTIDLESFNIHAFAIANGTGVIYHFASGHTLELSMETGDYDSLLRWARLDGEIWPKDKEGVRKPLGSLDYDFSSPAQHH